MKHFDTSKHRGFFKVLASTRDSQAATMVLKAGQSTTDEPENEHAKCEQWLYVVSGTGRAIVGKKRTALKDGSLLLIEKGEPHQITNTSRTKAMVTVNFYAPPAYTADGEVKPSAK
jgi:mannose-6-phosphate isomerase-like protein (cupin superfamily)